MCLAVGFGSGQEVEPINWIQAWPKWDFGLIIRRWKKAAVAELQYECKDIDDNNDNTFCL